MNSMFNFTMEDVAELYEVVGGTASLFQATLAVAAERKAALNTARALHAGLLPGAWPPCLEGDTPFSSLGRPDVHPEPYMCRAATTRVAPPPNSGVP